MTTEKRTVLNIAPFTRVDWLWILAGLYLAAVVAGCGLVFQGKTQKILLQSEPSGAKVTFNGSTGTAPTTMEFHRRQLGWEVLRGELDGYHPACVVTRCGTPAWIAVLNSLPLGIPWIFDAAAGTHRACRPVLNVRLKAIEPGETSYSLPSDQYILHARSWKADVCATPHMFDADFAKAARRILVTTGNLQRPYVELGPVDFGAVGSDVTRATTFAAGRFAFTGATRTFSKATPAEINRLMQLQALYQYKDQVDAIINVSYETNPRNDVFGTGLAVRFIDGDTVEAPGKGATADRLQRLDDLRDRELISDEEYERLRQDILREL